MANSSVTPQPTLFDLPITPDGFGVIMPPAQLRRLDFSGLDYQTARRAIVEYIMTYYPSQFNDFVASNGMMMMVEIVASTVAKLSTRSDILSNEAFLPTASTVEAVSNHLALINQSIQRQTPAIVDILCTVNQPVFTDIQIPAGTVFTARSSSATSTTGSVQYELYRAPGDFVSDTIIPAGKSGVIAYGLHGITIGPLQFISDGTSSQQYAINDQKMLTSPITVTVTAGIDVTTWTVVMDAIQNYGPNDRVVQVYWEGDTAILLFGDNINGAAPLPGNVVKVTYRSGGGIIGRIGSGQINESRQLLPNPPANSPVIVKFVNSSPSSGGTDVETIAQAKLRAPRDFSVRTGVVTADDYVNVAQGFTHPVYGSILKAAATVRTGLNANLVQVYVLAAGPDGLPTAPNAGLKSGLSTFYNQYNVLTDHVEVLDGLILGVDINMTVVISRSADASVVKTNVEAAVSSFFEVSNWNMGQPLYTSNFIDVVANIDGVAHVDLYTPNDNILPNIDGGVMFNQMIIQGNTTIQYYYQSQYYN